jgi:transglutaminase/protease-like cytokinesis protein 3
MEKKLISVLLILCMLLTGCFPKQSTHYEMRQDLGIYLTNVDEVVESVRAALVRRDYSITICYTSHQDNLEDLGTIVRELMEFACSETDSAQEGDYLRYSMGGYTMHSSYRTEGELYHYEVTILPEYYTSAEEEMSVSERVREILNELDFDRNTGDFQKIQSVAAYLKEHIRYDEIHAKNPNHHRKATAYAALVQGQAVCQGYAAAAYRLLREAGVSVRILTGTAGEQAEFHAWNLVCIDGLYYNLDVTWDDTNGNDACFLKSDADFPEHTRDAQFLTTEFYEQYPMAAQSYAPEEDSNE